jgi:hypothetical protein
MCSSWPRRRLGSPREGRSHERKADGGGYGQGRRGRRPHGEPAGLPRDADHRPRDLGLSARPRPAERALRRAMALDVNFVDTADSYGPGVSERRIAEGLYPYSEELVIAAKGGLVRPGPDGGSPTAARSTRTGPARSAFAGYGWTGFTCTSSTGPTPRCRSPSRSARWPSLKDEGKILHIGESNVTQGLSPHRWQLPGAAARPSDRWRWPGC